MARPDSGIGDDHEGQMPKKNDSDLKPWINVAASEGLYTGEQLGILKAQRQRVADSIRDAELSFHLDQTIGRRPLTELASNSAPNLGSLAFGKPRSQSNSTKSAVSLKMFPDCTYRACSCCR